MTIKTIEEITREYLDDAAKAALATFRDAVKPIYGATDRGVPDHIGTACRAVASTARQDGRQCYGRASQQSLRPFLSDARMDQLPSEDGR